MVNSIAANENTVFAGTSSAAGSGSLYVSTDNGVNWSPISLGNSGVFSVAVNGNTIFAGAYSQGVYISTDNSLNWNQSSLNNLYVISITVSGSNIFAGTNSNGLFRSSNNGANWVQSLLTPQKVNSLTAGGSSIIAGTNTGVYISHDYGISWTQRNEGMGDAFVNAVFIFNNYILAVTNRVYRRLLSEVIGIGLISNVIPSQYLLSQNYPSPFNPQTVINFSIPKADYSSIKIYDIKGALKQSYEYGYLKAGEYSTEFEGTKLSSGVYFYEFQSGNFVQTKKMILLK